MYGFLDESGSPGIANNDNDFLVASLVLFANVTEKEKCSQSISKLRKRLKLPENYEFHRSHNSLSTQKAFIQLMNNLKFQFISVAIKKNQSYKFASYDYLAKLLLKSLSEYQRNIQIKMDENPIFFMKLKQNKKKLNLHHLHFSQATSLSDNLIQLADYVASISMRKVKNNDISDYLVIKSEQITFVQVND